VLGAAGISMALAGGASATMPIAKLDNASFPETALYEEEISNFCFRYCPARPHFSHDRRTISPGCSRSS